MNERKAVCIERCPYSLVGGRWNRAEYVPRQRPTQPDNRRRPEGWLPPSLHSKAEATVKAVSFIASFVPVGGVSVEVGSFDTQKLQNPDIAHFDYQHGERAT